MAGKQPDEQAASRHDVVAYHHGDLRRTLIAVGRALLADGGPPGVSLREVARAAGVSHNAPYRHFESREALLAAIATDGFEQLSTRLVSAANAEAGRAERLVAIGRAYVAFAIEAPSLYRLMFSSEISKSGFPALRTAADRAYEQLAAAIPVSSAKPRDTALGAWALVHGLADLLTTSQVSDDLRGRLLEDAIDHILEAYAAGAVNPRSMPLQEDLSCGEDDIY
ncbi:TetR/AcrR family transcriptional regulator [Pleomorphomonas sp. NRK KF1]|uniref:TetR/AcrR family transcriptional regulator n=1 Tax=Pleomorphomonas sp. NRK KF1 TaxID=2943000 RepID=UPI002043FFA6|nr:TetR/AcrR family transcriptional regulator [Pleomorphomonas sp. NRK KF1]MCM5551649.1 TetR/AcrR family transcriptional regulator [Pleomorphomonas sp. NRK KF1]